LETGKKTCEKHLKSAVFGCFWHSKRGIWDQKVPEMIICCRVVAGLLPVIFMGRQRCETFLFIVFLLLLFVYVASVARVNSVLEKAKNIGRYPPASPATRQYPATRS